MERNGNIKSPPNENMSFAYNNTDNSYESSSGSDSEESNASLLEKSSLMTNKFMLPKDLCDVSAIFDEFFSHSLWDLLPSASRQHLVKFLPVFEENQSSATQVVHDLLSHKLHRFGVDPLLNFRQSLAKGNFRADIVKLQHNLANSLIKERRMVELQRMGRLAQNMVLSREVAMLSELHSNSIHSLTTSLKTTADQWFPLKIRNRWVQHAYSTQEMVKCRNHAKKRYLSEIVNISDTVGISLSVSDEEDFLDAMPTGPIRKQRRIYGAVPQLCHDILFHSQRNSSINISPGTAGINNIGGKKSNLNAGLNGAGGGNAFDGTMLNAPKLFLVTEEHYRKLLLQHRKRKVEEPDHPELDLEGIKLKDVVSRTQIAAGYRRILPLPKVYISESNSENIVTGKSRMKSNKFAKSYRSLEDFEDIRKINESKSTAHKPEQAKLSSEQPREMIVDVVKQEQKNNDKKIKTDQSTDDIDNINLEKYALQSMTDECRIDDYTEEKMISTPSSDVDVTTTNAVSENAKNMVQLIETPLKAIIYPSEKKSSSNTSLVSLSTGTAGSMGTEEISTGHLLGNKTHACFLSVVRDLFCSNPDHRSTMSDLQLKLDTWIQSPAANRCAWYGEYHNSDSWHSSLHSAVQFLAGEFCHLPEDFVPYIEHKVTLNILQWIGASRDGDSRLVPLCAYWQNKKQNIEKSSGLHIPVFDMLSCNTGVTSSLPQNENIMADNGIPAIFAKVKGKSATNTKLLLSSSSSTSSSSSLSSVSSLTTAGDVSVSMLPDSTASTSISAINCAADDDGTISERSVSPPPPLFPTDWSVRKATDEEINSFREQEKRRYENPHMSFTFKQHSYDSVVGPVKGIYTQVPGISKARGHSMLVADRPNFVTILTLVRDATARLPNGEGTRADICELLKSSQYISRTATDQVLQTIVSGALDRMHTEHDPCVKYDAKRKIWIYLHRNRTEQEFERLHMQYQGFTKHRKPVAKKSLKYCKDSILASIAPKNTLFGDCSFNNLNLSNNLTEVDRDSLTSFDNVLDLPSVTITPAADDIPDSAITIAENSSPISSTSGIVLPTTSLLKKQSVAALLISNQASCTDVAAKSSANDLSLLQDRSKESMYSIHHDSTEEISDPTQKSSVKRSGGVTLFTSVGNNLKTIQIPKSSLSLAIKSVTTGTSVAASSDSTSNDNSDSNVSQVEYKTPTIMQTSQNAALVADRTSKGTTSISPSSCLIPKPIADVSRKTTSSPLMVPSTGVSHCSFVATPKEGIKLGTSLGGTIVSIRQVNNGTSISTTSSNIHTSIASSSPICVLSTSPVSSQISVQAKGMQPITASANATSSSANLFQTCKSSTTIAGTIAKPIYSNSIGTLNIKQNQATASVVHTNVANVVPQKMAAADATVCAQATGESNVLVGIKSTSTANMVPNAHRVIKSSANLFSTITLAKGQQSILTPAQQKQIIQNLLSQQHKQSTTTKKIVTQSSSITKIDASSSAPGETNDTNLKGSSPSLVLDKQTNLVTNPVIKVHQKANHNIKALSPQIVKITTRNRNSGISTLGPVVNTGSIAVSTMSNVSSSSAVIQASSGVKMMKMHSAPAQGILSSSAIATGNVLASAASLVTGMPTITTTTSPATMRVLKTATGSTTLIKTELTGAGSSPQQLSQGIVHHTIAKLRRENASPAGSKVIVTPNISTGQLIPLESLLQKQGITAIPTNASGSGSAFLKIAGTTKTGQPQFLQFTAASNATSAAALTPGSNVHPISAVSSGGHQYTILPQARNIISVPATTPTPSTVNRHTNLPVTIVSSTTTNSNESFQSGASIIVPTSKMNFSEIGTVTGSTSLFTHTTSISSGKQIPQATKMKVATTTNTPQTFSSSSATPTSSIQQPKTVFGVKTSLAGGGEFLNAKIIGVRNVANAKVKGTSSLSLMNASNLNIAHIGGKQVIIANNSTLGANQSVVGNSTRINSNTSSIVPNTNTMLLSANNNCSNLVIEQQCLKDKKVHTETYATEREGSSTVSGLSEQTVMLRTQLVKAKSVQPTAGTRLTNQRCNTTFPTENSGTVNEIKNTARLAAQGSVTVQQQHQQQQRPDHNINTGGINAPSTSNVGMVTTVVTPMMSKSIVIQPTSSGNINSNTKVTEIGLPKTQSQRVVLSQPIIIPSSLQTSSSISLKRLKVIPINKQCKK